MTLRELERSSIRQFVAGQSEWFAGAVLDFGCGTQPYRDIVEAAGGDYFGFDRRSFPGSCAAADVGGDDPLRNDWDAILCTQVIQYQPDPSAMLQTFGDALFERGGVLVLTGPTNWPEVEPWDLCRFTLEGAKRLAEDAGLDVVDAVARASVTVEGERWPLGWGLVARPQR